MGWGRLYRIRFTYPESWAVGLDGGWQQMFSLAGGTLRRSGHQAVPRRELPRKKCAAGPFRPDFRVVIEAGGGAVIMVE